MTSGPFLKAIKSFALAAALACALAMSTWAELLPKLETPEEKLKFLLLVRQEIPELFTEAAQYDIDLMAILEDQKELQHQLAKHPQYVSKIEKKLASLKTFTFKSAQGIASETVRIAPESIEAWKRDMSSVLEAELAAKKNGFGIEDLHSATKKALLEAKKKQAPALLGGLVASLDGELKSKLGPLLKGKAIEEVVEILAKELPVELPARFRFSSQGFERMPDRAQFLEELGKRAKANRDATLLLHADLLFSRPELAGGRFDLNRARSEIEALGENELRLLLDPDFVGPKTDALVQAWGSEAKGLNGKKDLAEPAQKAAGKFAERTIKVQEKAVGGEVRLREVEPGIAIFRGCTGGDCSSQYSFPYPNDPNERVFFVYDQNDRLKGYVSATEVNAGGKKSLYVITVSGNRINATDTKLILNGLAREKAALGVSQILLPEANRLPGLLNFPSIRDAFDDYVSGGKTVQIQHEDDVIRGAIERFGSSYNHGQYDHRANNRAGVVFEGDPKLSASLATSAGEATQRGAMPEIDRGAVIEFALDMKHSGRHGMAEQALSIARIDKRAFEGLVESLENPGQRNVEAWREAVFKRLETMGASRLESKAHLFHRGRLNAPDAFAPENRKETIRGVIEDLKRYLKGDVQDEPFKLLRARREQLLEDTRFAKLIDEMKATLGASVETGKIATSAQILAVLRPPGYDAAAALSAAAARLGPEASTPLIAPAVHRNLPELKPFIIECAKGKDAHLALYAIPILAGFPDAGQSVDVLLEIAESSRGLTRQIDALHTIRTRIPKNDLRLDRAQQLKLAFRMVHDPNPAIRDSSRVILSRNLNGQLPEVAIAAKMLLSETRIDPYDAADLVELLNRTSGLDDATHALVVGKLVRGTEPLEGAISDYIVKHRPSPELLSPLLEKYFKETSTRYPSHKAQSAILAAGATDKRVLDAAAGRIRERGREVYSTEVEFFGKLARGRADQLEVLDSIAKAMESIDTIYGMPKALAGARARILLADENRLFDYVETLVRARDDLGVMGVLEALQTEPALKDPRFTKLYLELARHPSSFEIAQPAIQLALGTPSRDATTVAEIKSLSLSEKTNRETKLAAFVALSFSGDLQGDSVLQAAAVRSVVHSGDDFGDAKLVRAVVRSKPKAAELIEALVDYIGGKNSSLPEQAAVLEYFKANGIFPASADVRLAKMVESASLPLSNAAASLLAANAESLTPEAIRILEGIAESSTGAKRSRVLLVLNAVPARAGGCDAGLAGELGAIVGGAR